MHAARPTSRRALLAAVAGATLTAGAVEGQSADAVSGEEDLVVNVHYPPGSPDAGALAREALLRVDQQFASAEEGSASGEPPLEVGVRTLERSFGITDYDDRLGAIREVEAALFEGGRSVPGGPNTVDVVLYEHGLPWHVTDDLGGAGFATWLVGAPAAEERYCDGETPATCSRRFEDAAGPYSLAFVNAGLRNPLDRLLLAALGYDADELFANTVVHEVGHCLGATHDLGDVHARGFARLASPMLTWYCERRPLANPWPGDCCRSCDGHAAPTGHAPTLSACTRERFREHASEYL